MTDKVLESERLYLREYTLDDVDLMFELNCDPEVMTFIGPPRTDIKVAEESIQKLIKYYSKHPGLGVWAAIEKESEEHIGFFELAHMDNTEEIEVGYRLHKKFWGKGYATEMTKVLIDYGFNKKNLDEIVGITHHENYASQNVLKKAGLVYIRDDHFYNLDVKYFRIIKATNNQKENTNEKVFS